MFGASSELASVTEFGFYCTALQQWVSPNFAALCKELINFALINATYMQRIISIVDTLKAYQAQTLWCQVVVHTLVTLHHIPYSRSKHFFVAII